jgi:hypothetical protein
MRLYLRGETTQPLLKHTVHMRGKSRKNPDESLEETGGITRGLPPERATRAPGGVELVEGS